MLDLNLPLVTYKGQQPTNDRDPINWKDVATMLLVGLYIGIVIVMVV